MQCNITIIAAMEPHSATIYIGWWLVSLDFFSPSLEQVLATSVFSFASLTRKGPWVTKQPSKHLKGLLKRSNTLFMEEAAHE